MEKHSLANELAGTSAVVIEDQIDLLNYRRDASVCAAGDAAAAVLVSSADEIVRVVKAAREANQPVYIRGAGSTYAGGANPTRGGIVIDVSPMNRIVEIDRGRGLVVVEPGVTYGELLAVLGRDGLTVGIVPLTGASGTIGGAIASHGLGTGSPKYQSTGDEVAGLEVILPNGELLRTGSAALAGAGFFQRYAIGPDLTGLFLGANGTLGVITKLALWVHPLPPHQETLTLGFSDYAAGARFTAHAQLHEMFRNVWYGAGYEDKAVAARINAARPDLAGSAMPGFCLGLDLRGDPREVAGDRLRLIDEASRFAGGEFAPFDEIFFSKLRRDFSFWYGYAGYFSRSMCALLMTSMPTETAPRFFALVDRMRALHSDFVWAGGTVLCRRGVHGAVIMFYDEQHQWPAAQAAASATCAELLAIGCVPYKSGKMWAPLMDRFGSYYRTLRTLKRSLDPRSLFCPDNLAL